MNTIVLRGGPYCGEEIQAGRPPETWRMPQSPVVGSFDPNPTAYTPIIPVTVDYRRTGLRSVSGAHIYDWVGLNWGTSGAVAA